MATEVPPYVREKYYALFHLLDIDKDGALTEDDHAQMGVRATVAYQLTRGSDEAARVIEAFRDMWTQVNGPMDRDGDGAIDADEFIAATTTLHNDPALFERTVAALVDANLQAADPHHGETMDLRGYGGLVRAHSPHVPQPSIEAAFIRLDLDGDGTISRAELTQHFRDYLTSPDRSTPGNWLFGPPPA